MDKLSIEEMKQIGSHSRYRGITDKSRYSLTDEYIYQMYGENLICTDKECDIDCDGNLCLITPYGDVVHLSEIPITEAPAPKARVSLNGDEIDISYKVYLDNGHHHSLVKHEKINLKEYDYLSEIVLNRAKQWINENVKQGNVINEDFRYWQKYDLKIGGIKYKDGISVEIYSYYKLQERFCPTSTARAATTLGFEEEKGFYLKDYSFDVWKGKVKRYSDDIEKHGTGLNKDIDQLLSELNPYILEVVKTYNNKDGIKYYNDKTSEKSETHKKKSTNDIER